MRFVSRISRFLAIIASVFLIGLSGTAFAQSGPKTLSAPPADTYAITPGGVDMRTGTYTYKNTDLSIGSGDGALTLVRTLGFEVWGHVAPMANFSHNWDIMLTQKRINIQTGSILPDSGPDYQVSIHFGGRSQTLRASGNGGFSSASFSSWGALSSNGNRSTGAVIYTYTASDGTVVEFRTLANGDCSSMTKCAYASWVRLPDGTRYDLAYENPTPGTPNTTRLKSVTSSNGYALVFDYNSGNFNLVSRACVINLALAPTPGACPATPLAATSYGYGSVNGPRLTQVTDASNKVWAFGYSGSGPNMTMTFTKPGASAPWLTNTINTGINIDNVPQEFVQIQALASGSSYTYSYANAPQKSGEPLTIAGGTYSGPSGNITVAYDFPILPGTGVDAPCNNPTGCSPYDVPENGDDPAQLQQTSGPATIIDALGRTTTNDYCDPYAAANYPASYQSRCLVSVLQSTTDPEGGVTKFTWDIPNQLVLQIRKIAKPGSGLADIVTSATYNCGANRLVCAKPTSVTDAKGNVTTYTYDAAHGGILTATMPAVKVNGTGSPIAPVKRYAYALRYAWISNGAGGYVAAATPVWLLASEKTCRTSATVNDACAGGATDEVVTAYDYGPDSGPNNLLLRGVAVTAEVGGTMTTLRTCYGYDAKGRKVSETKPRAGLGGCA